MIALLFAIVFILFAVFSALCAFHCPFDGHDAYAFIEQSRRLVDPIYSHASFNFIRPRGLIFVLSLYERAFHAIYAHFPTLEQYHVFSWVVALLFILVWTKAASLYFDKAVAFLLGIFLCLHYLVFVQSSSVASDILIGLLWGIVSIAYLKLTDPSLRRVRKNLWALTLGISAGVMALSKYQDFFLFPLLMGLTAVARRGPKRCQAPFGTFPMAKVLLVYVVTVDLVQRFTGEWSSGFWYTIKIFSTYPAGHGAIALLPRSAWTYLADFYQTYGIAFCLLAAVAGFLFFRTRRHQKTLNGKVLSPLTLWLVTNAGYLLFNQAIIHREPRYLLPFLPAVLMVIAKLIVDETRRTKPMLKAIWVTLLCLALVPPVAKQWRTYHSLRERNVQWHETGYEKFWNYLRSSENGSCKAVLACQTELDLTHYAFFLPELPTNVRFCEGQANTYRKQLASRPLQSYCYVIANSTNSDYEGLGNPVVVEKTAGLDLDEAEMNRLLHAQMFERPSSVLNCEKTGSHRYHCFRDKSFFGVSPVPLS